MSKYKTVSVLEKLWNEFKESEGPLRGEIEVIERRALDEACELLREASQILDKEGYGGTSYEIDTFLSQIKDEGGGNEI